MSTSDRETLAASAAAAGAEAAPESSDYVLTADTARILVVDDEKVIREILADFLSMEGYVVHTVEDGVAALEELKQRSYNLVISDLKMPNMGGLELLAKITEESIPVLTVIMTGFGTVETAIEAMKKGAYDYILKPFKVEEVIHIVQRGLDRQRLQHENIRLKEALSIYKISEAIATSLSVEKVLDLVLDATIDDVDADVVSLLLEDPTKEGHFTERMRKVSERAEPERRGARAEPRRGAAAVPRGPPAARAAAAAPTATSRRRRTISIAGWSASAASRSSCNQRIIGMLNAYSYTRGSKFSEGQRKMLSVLASRAAVSIENARLYENLRRREQGPRRAPTSRSRRTSSRRSSASRTRSRSRTATRAATPSASRCTRA